MTRNYSHYSIKFFAFAAIFILTSDIAFLANSSIFGEQDKMLQQAAAFPSLAEEDTNLNIQVVASGLSEPTGIAFVNNSTILILEKGGQVRMILNGHLIEEPILTLPVDSINERGLLGIAVMQNIVNDQNNLTKVTNPAIESLSIPSGNNFEDRDRKNKIEVFLYFTERLPASTDPLSSTYTSMDSSDEELRNRVYKYEWENQNLTNPELILDLPALPGPNHNGGKIAIGPDDYLYVIIGDLNHKGKLQNLRNGPEPDDTGVILRINPNQSELESNIDYNNSSLSSFRDDNNIPTTTIADIDDSKYNITQRYYAYGIRNSFGIAFDPVTGNLWETENGFNEYDEINVITPGFNSGWQAIMGPLSRNGNDTNTILRDKLVLFPGSYYSDPVISWKQVVAPTAIEFINSSKLGDGYEDNIFVGDYKNGNLYFLKVNNTRNGISLGMDNNGIASQRQNNRSLIANSTVNLSDLVVDNTDELSALVFGTGFGSITDIKTGPDGYVYIVSFHDGILYRIVPSGTTISYSPEGEEQQRQQSSYLNLSEMLLPQATELINSKHEQSGGVNGSLGRPVSNVSITSDGLAFSRLYEIGAIYLKMGGIPHEVHGSIYNKWKDIGAELSELGYPLSDQTPSSSGDGGGYFNLFEHGAIYWTPSTGAHAIYGDIYNRWKTLGAELSELGYPLTDVENVAEGEDGSISYFQGGSVRVFSNNGTVQVYHSKDYADIIMGQNDTYDIY
jgi:aldose sugar dehydrogenase